MRILDGLNQIKDENLISFHMPGHKNGRLLSFYFSEILKYDITEIPGADNLHQPVEMIKGTEDVISEYFHSIKSYIVVNGSTAGIYSAVMAVAKAGEQLIISRECHRSVYSALLLGGITAEYIYPEMDESSGAYKPIALEQVKAQMNRFPKAKGLVITSPTYFGLISPIKEIADYLHSIDKVLIVDEAHGAHLKISPLLPTPAIDNGADIAVQSFHKTLPALTQASVLHLNSHRIDKKRLERLLQIHQTSSPSYLIMASIDASMMIVKEKGKTLIDELLINIRNFERNLEGNDYLKVLKYENVIIDPTRLVLINKYNKKIDFNELETVLRSEYQIQVEYSYDKGIVLIPSIANVENDFILLFNALNSIEFEKLLIDEHYGTIEHEKPIQRISVRDAFYRTSEIIDFTDSVKRISAEFIIPYPPGVPMLVPGEVIDASMIRKILNMKEWGFNILGLEGTDKNKIAVIEEEI
ncbi:MAG: aminotransferase class I/II-fold pyridoxal phosphate-dependent enzyme [Clostridiales bacterium]|nr:aminotransferase class I/II-fold pyridoxal phosphate-dependent enzyme [Clostridiales bacterium]